MELLEELKQKITINENGIFQSEVNGYWSNLTKSQNEKLVQELKKGSTRDAIRSVEPGLEDIIFSPKRPAGLELLDLSGEETCVDFGCMWGALTIPLAKRTRFVLGVDQTLESLLLLHARVKEEKLGNVALMQHNLREMPLFSSRADVAVVNGVLEWIPEEGQVDLKTFFGRRTNRKYQGNPKEHQEKFLRMVHSNLRDGGKLYLAIENRYDLNTFLGAPDPHNGLLFTSFTPRPVSNLISKLFLGRSYVNWIYSFKALRKLLLGTGFQKVDLYMCFPNYRYPERILPFNHDLSDFSPTLSPRNSRGEATLKRKLARIAELTAFRYLKLRNLAPSIIAIAYR